jgi:hypothetical protein
MEDASAYFSQPYSDDVCLLEKQPATNHMDFDSPATWNVTREIEKAGFYYLLFSHCKNNTNEDEGAHRPLMIYRLLSISRSVYLSMLLCNDMYIYIYIYTYICLFLSISMNLYLSIFDSLFNYV